MSWMFGVVVGTTLTVDVPENPSCLLSFILLSLKILLTSVAYQLSGGLRHRSGEIMEEICRVSELLD